MGHADVLFDLRDGAYCSAKRRSRAPAASADLQLHRFGSKACQPIQPGGTDPALIQINPPIIVVQ
jgi:hypothetical protein